MSLFANIPRGISIVEVGPRDGLQNESKVLDTDVKERFIRSLVRAGLSSIEVTSFVRPDRIAQMADARELFPRLADLNANLSALVPNLKGLEAALECGVKTVVVFTATSDTFNKKNINATVQGSFDRIKPVIKKALSEGLRVRGYVSTVFGCPYEGVTSPEKLWEVSERLLELGVYQVSLGDTIGVAHPAQVESLLGDERWDRERIALHFHDTQGMALANILTALQLGYHTFDSSAGGLGGCPYAPGASGNVATEQVVRLCQGLGVECGVDLEKLEVASREVFERIGVNSQ